MRGEYHYICQTRTKRWGSPPLARGIQLWRQPSNLESGITPACAGNTLLLRTNETSSWDHPRLRGEYRITYAFRFVCPGSPPLARGIQSCLPAHTISMWITPACAGNTRLYCLRSDARQGSPPLARGILISLIQSVGFPGITPACAGNTCENIEIQSICKDHPRLRGEYLSTSILSENRKGSPPLARGIH